MQWYYVENGQQRGPVDEDALSALIRDGQVKPDDYIWNATMGQQWARVKTVPAFLPAVGAVGDSPPATIVASFSAPRHDAGPRGATPNRELTAQARGSLSGQWTKAVLGFGVFVAASIVVSILPKPLDSIVNLLISGPLALGLAIFFLALGDGATPAVEMIFHGFKRFGTAFLAQLLVSLISLVSALPGIAIMIIVCGKWFLSILKLAMSGAPPTGWPMPPTGFWIALIVVIIPTTIVSIRLGMTYFVIAGDPNVGATEALGRGAAMMKNHCWKFFCLMLRFVGWGILTIFTFFIGMLWLVPYIYTSMARFYRDVQPVDGAA